MSVQCNHKYPALYISIKFAHQRVNRPVCLSDQGDRSS
uniref:Uncharacterized protein n=1 Tax=Anguilla anguilla TaxID=7936 RepID=A0A0E9PTG7_ANGAN